MPPRAARGLERDSAFTRALRLVTLPWNDGEEGKFVASLEMYEFSNPEIELPDGTNIRRRTNEVEAIMAGLSLSHTARELSEFVVTTRVSGKRFTDAEGEARETFDNVITSLRLVGARQVRLGDGFAIQEDTPDSARPIAFWYRSSGLPPLWKLLPYALAEGGADDLRDVYGKVPHAFEGRARVAISRFGSAHTRSTEEDRFIDIWIGLEALFSPTDKLEVRYRIALRVAHFIAESAEEREDIYRTALGSYDLRSQVVHGRKLTIRQPKNLDISAHEVVTRTEDYLRRSLHKIALSRQSLEEQVLDIAIARGRQGKDS